VLFTENFETRLYVLALLVVRRVHRNVVSMGIPWETSHGMGQHTFVFPMRQ